LEKGDRLHKEGFNCAEAVLRIVADEWDIRDRFIPRVATGFGGGLGRQGYICGALSGGVITIGLRYGRDMGGDTAARDKSYAMVRKLFKRFREEFGSVHCRELVGVDLTTPEGLERLKAIWQERCARFIVRTAETVLELTGS